MQAFDELAAQGDDAIDVAVGAALIARDVYGSLDVGALLARFDDLANGLPSLEGLPALEQARRLSGHVYGTLCFHGNEKCYYDPRNSLLPDVIEQRTGIPISLALVYQEVGRRRGVRTDGISFPGHFLVQVREAGSALTPAEPPVYVDPFFGGRVLGAGDLGHLFQSVAAQASLKMGEKDLRDQLVPATPRAILVRWLMNLRGVYLQRGDRARALVVLDRLVSLSQGARWALRERGVLAAQLGAVESGRSDLERALAHASGTELDQIMRDLAHLPARAALN